MIATGFRSGSNRMYRLTSGFICLIVLQTTPLAAQTSDFSGEWETTFGLLTLTQNGEAVQGDYEVSGERSTLEGTVQGPVLNFQYREGAIEGVGRFQLSDDGRRFTGRWREQGGEEWYPWNGTRQAVAGFEGLWETTFGRMRLVAADDHVQGIYALGAGSTIDGTVEEGRLTFQYREPEVDGKGWFELSEDGQSFTGQWRETGSAGWAGWEGRRVEPRQGLQWLVVLEARWESGLVEREYSFGGMLKSYFARIPNVEVRHRFFDNAESLKHWSGELAYLAEPVVVVIASHGDDEGLTVNGRTIGAEELADCFSYAGTTRLVHFSACRIMASDAPERMQQNLGPKGVDLPVSGYKTEVDWSASALIEFLYLDLILGRGLDPRAAAEQVLKLAPFSGDQPVPGAVIPSAGFRLLVPEPEAGALREAA
jgi:hypothetical protein